MIGALQRAQRVWTHPADSAQTIVGFDFLARIDLVARKYPDVRLGTTLGPPALFLDPLGEVLGVNVQFIREADRARADRYRMAPLTDTIEDE